MSLVGAVVFALRGPINRTMLREEGALDGTRGSRSMQLHSKIELLHHGHVVVRVHQLVSFGAVGQDELVLDALHAASSFASENARRKSAALCAAAAALKNAVLSSLSFLR